MFYLSLSLSIHPSSYLPVIYLSVYLYLSVFYSCLSTYLSIIHVSIYVCISLISEKAMAPHSSTLAWQIPWTEEPCRLQSMGSLRVGHDWASFHFVALEKEVATHSSVLAWRLPGMGEPGGLPAMGSHRVGHDWSDLAAAGAGAACLISGAS